MNEPIPHYDLFERITQFLESETFTKEKLWRIYYESGYPEAEFVTLVYGYLNQFITEGVTINRYWMEQRIHSAISFLAELFQTKSSIVVNENGELRGM